MKTRQSYCNEKKGGASLAHHHPVYNSPQLTMQGCVRIPQNVLPYLALLGHPHSSSIRHGKQTDFDVKYRLAEYCTCRASKIGYCDDMVYMSHHYVKKIGVAHSCLKSASGYLKVTTGQITRY